ncbi:uncharacterized protein FOMMEDRAFT_31593 [Fomitiporia mediterranea MF3/22]|uniref:uncharacterized protein n=1 Tax=Fomitiporia mediterranea (strain MF3/22) TaxID=694068 RepID=UPI000440902B|nr:uncharacterized protein FOMMEDRAFT_31593 [Fomitiporia mediterranea MF3/22]EJC99076.1 hypothetical protein FOMMEDRAFT_31593 [Fomitiporia mediterranea MF3/22]
MSYLLTVRMGVKRLTKEGKLLDKYEETNVVDPEYKEDLINISTVIYTTGLITSSIIYNLLFLLAFYTDLHKLMMRDEKYFSNLDTFVPERHIEMAKTEMSKADSIETVNDTNILSMFDIKPHVNPKTGKTEIPKLEFESNKQVVYLKTVIHVQLD